ncbi:MAG: flagellar protein FliT [Lachnospiraceae bacterium]|nr:flagellar protein FliT [Lachnospiraceae bacterium]
MNEAEVRNYLHILMDSLKKKMEILLSIEASCKRQAEVIQAEPFDMEQLDETFEEKGRLIDALGEIDDGFSSVYDRIKEELEVHKELYKQEILTMQEQIRRITDMSVSIQAQEMRNRSGIDGKVTMRRQELGRKRSANHAAQAYFQNMSKTGAILPQFMDKKN